MNEQDNKPMTEPTPQENQEQETEQVMIRDDEIHALANIPDGTPASDVERIRFTILVTQDGVLMPGQSRTRPARVFHSVILKGDTEAPQRMKVKLLEQTRSDPKFDSIADTEEVFAPNLPGIYMHHEVVPGRITAVEDLKLLWDDAEGFTNETSFHKLVTECLGLHYIPDIGAQVINQHLEGRQRIMEAPLPAGAAEDAQPLRMGIGMLAVKGEEPFVMVGISKARNKSVRIVLDPARLREVHNMINPPPAKPRFLVGLEEIEDGALVEALEHTLAGKR